MSSNPPETLVAVYATPLEFDAEMVKAMLADEEIPCSVENANSPFPGVTAVQCQVMVASEHEVHARQLIEIHEAQVRERASIDPETETEIEAE